MGLHRLPWGNVRTLVPPECAAQFNSSQPPASEPILPSRAAGDSLPAESPCPGGHLRRTVPKGHTYVGSDGLCYPLPQDISSRKGGPATLTGRLDPHSRPPPLSPGAAAWSGLTLPLHRGYLSAARTFRCPGGGSGGHPAPPAGTSATQGGGRCRSAFRRAARSAPPRPGSHSLRRRQRRAEQPRRATASFCERWRGLSAASSRWRFSLWEGAGLGEVQPRQRGGRRRVPVLPVCRRQENLHLRRRLPPFSSAPGPVGSPRCKGGHGDSAPASPPLSCSRRRYHSCCRLLLLLPAELLMARTSGGQAWLPLHQPQRGELAGARAAPAPRTVRTARRTMGPGGSVSGRRPPRRAPRRGLRGRRRDPPAGRRGSRRPGATPAPPPAPPPPPRAVTATGPRCPANTPRTLPSPA